MVMTDKDQLPHKICRADDRVEALMDAALRAFRRQGVERTRVYDIATEAGLSPGTFYLYFESKDDLLRGLWQTRSRAFDDLTQGID